jgi:23S rRNA-intervening sequence protein
MALSHELPIYKDVYKLILMIFDRTKDFSREYKYTLGQDIKRDSMFLVRSIYRANRNIDKRQYLEEFLDNFEILKLELRLCADLKLLSIKHLAEVSKMLDIIRSVGSVFCSPFIKCAVTSKRRFHYRDSYVRELYRDGTTCVRLPGLAKNAAPRSASWRDAN